MFWNLDPELRWGSVFPWPPVLVFVANSVCHFCSRGSGIILIGNPVPGEPRSIREIFCASSLQLRYESFNARPDLDRADIGRASKSSAGSLAVARDCTRLYPNHNEIVFCTGSLNMSWETYVHSQWQCVIAVRPLDPGGQ